MTIVAKETTAVAPVATVEAAVAVETKAKKQRAPKKTPVAHTDAALEKAAKKAKATKQEAAIVLPISKGPSKKAQVKALIAIGATVKSMSATMQIGETAIRSLIGDLRRDGVAIECDRLNEAGPYYTLAPVATATKK